MIFFVIYQENFPIIESNQKDHQAQIIKLKINEISKLLLKCYSHICLTASDRDRSYVDLQ